MQWDNTDITTVLRSLENLRKTLFNLKEKQAREAQEERRNTIALFGDLRRRIEALERAQTTSSPPSSSPDRPAASALTPPAGTKTFSGH